MVKSKAAKAAKKAVQKASKPRVFARDENGTVAVQPDQLPLDLQQSLLNIFSDACATGSASDMEAILQEVKGHLYNRDFATAFGKDEYLRVYAARWSPSRALGYAQVFHDVESFLFDLYQSGSGNELSDAQSVVMTEGDTETTYEEKELNYAVTASSSNTSGPVPLVNTAPQTKDISHRRPFRIACLGGGAGAEIVGLAGWLRTIGGNVSKAPAEESLSSSIGPLDVLCLDVAHWDNVMKDLYDHCITAPKLSKYASTAAQESNSALIDSDLLHVEFQQQDILDYTPAEVSAKYSNTDLVTIMFTLNELYSASVSKAQRLLHNLTASMREGALLLVVDSPGSYSAVTINGAERKYPMQWLLDHTLLDPPPKASGLPPKIFWEKLVSDESRWFRLQKEALKYPIELENMRYQIHLYRRCKALA